MILLLSSVEISNKVLKISLLSSSVEMSKLSIQTNLLLLMFSNKEKIFIDLGSHVRQVTHVFSYTLFLKVLSVLRKFNS